MNYLNQSTAQAANQYAVGIHAPGLVGAGGIGDSIATPQVTLDGIEGRLRYALQGEIELNAVLRATIERLEGGCDRPPCCGAGQVSASNAMGLIRTIAALIDDLVTVREDSDGIARSLAAV